MAALAASLEATRFTFPRSQRRSTATFPRKTRWHSRCSMNGMNAIAWVALPVLLLAAPSTQTKESIEIVVGKSTTVQIPFPIGTAANSNPEVLQAVPDVATRKLIFFGRRAGSATYTVFDARNRKRTLELEIRVVTASLAEEARLIREIVPEGIEVTVAGDRIILEG